SERGTNGSQRKPWQEVLDLEYQPLLENGTEKLSKLPIGYKVLPCQWVLAVKYNADGLGFVRCNIEYCIYVQKVGEHWIIVVVYVDDLTILSQDMRLINHLKFDLLSRFTMKDVGDIHYILKMEVRRNREKRTMSISQQSYVNEL
ncbi:Gag-pol Polyprotein, partial [Phytophthora megakarya]